jgi:CubicO group peptidase (beta-lactamase class C family)
LPATGGRPTTEVRVLAMVAFMGTNSDLAKRLTLAIGLLATATAAAAQPFEPFAPHDGARTRADGPRADLYGRARGYPACKRLDYIDDLGCRVGAFSAFESLFPSRTIERADQPSPLLRPANEPDVAYQFEGRTRSLDDYLDRHPVTGFLLAQGDTILIERYQYGRTPAHRLATFSMAKTVVGLLVGLAAADGAIRSIDDPAEAYAPDLKGTEIGRTPVKALLSMTSGLAFNEDYADRSSDIYKLARLTLEQDAAGSLGAVRQFDRRRSPPGAHFSYSSLDTVVLGLVLKGATGRTVADYAAEKLWQPLGAEAAAAWSLDATGHEVTYAYFHAVLRDWARLGLMLASGGAWAGRQIVPADWIKAATTADGWPLRTYGYQVWVSPYDPSRFLLSGLRQQYVLVDPKLKLVLVQTSLGGSPEADLEMTALWYAVRQRLTPG